MGVEGIVEDGPSLNDGSSVYLGRSSAAAFINEVRGNVHKSRRENSQGHQDMGDSPVSRSSRARGRKAEKNMANLMQQLVLPPRRVADGHLENYWSYIWPFNPILHRRTFQRR